MANLRRTRIHQPNRAHTLELDLLDPVAVRRFFDEEHPDAVVLAAAHVGGIMANSTYRADSPYTATFRSSRTL